MKNNQYVEALDKMSSICEDARKELSAIFFVVSKVEDISHSVNQISKIIDDLDKTIKTLNHLSSALTGIPIVGGLATAIKDILVVLESGVKSMSVTVKIIVSETKDVSKFTTDVSFFLEKLDNTLCLGASKLPKYSASLGVVDDFILILSLLEGYFDKVKLIYLLNERIEFISKKLEVVGNGINEILTLITHVEDEVIKVEQEIDEKTIVFRGYYDRFASGVDGIVRLFLPVVQGFEKLINAIAPLKWVLKAVSFLFNSILAPIINSILAALGLNEFLEKIKNKILDGLGFNSLVEELKNILSIYSLKDLIGNLNVIEDKLNYLMTSLDELTVDDIDTLLERVMKEAFSNTSDFTLEMELDLSSYYEETSLDGIVEVLPVWKRVSSLKVVPLRGIDVKDDIYETTLKVMIRETSQNINSYIDEVNIINEKMNTFDDNYVIITQSFSKLEVCRRVYQTMLHLVEEIEFYNDYIKVDLYNMKNFIEGCISSCDEISELLDIMISDWNGYREDFKCILLSFPSQADIIRMEAKLTSLAEQYDNVEEMFGKNIKQIEYYHLDNSYKLQVDKLSKTLKESVNDIIDSLKQVNILLGTNTKSLSKLQRILKEYEFRLDVVMSGCIGLQTTLYNTTGIMKILNTTDALIKPISHIISYFASNGMNNNYKGMIQSVRQQMSKPLNDIQYTDLFPIAAFRENVKYLSLISEKLGKEIKDIISWNKIEEKISEILIGKKEYRVGESIIQNYFVDNNVVDLENLFQEDIDNILKRRTDIFDKYCSLMHAMILTIELLLNDTESMEDRQQLALVENYMNEVLMQWESLTAAYKCKEEPIFKCILCSQIIEFGHAEMFGQDYRIIINLLFKKMEMLLLEVEIIQLPFYFAFCEEISGLHEVIKKVGKE